MRPAKIKQKVSAVPRSGGFRSEAGTEWQALIGDFITTLRKQNDNVVEQPTNVLQDRLQWGLSYQTPEQVLEGAKHSINKPSG